MMYDEPGGLPLEDGWWKRPIEDYRDQFRWCEMCGMPLKTFSRDAREETDDVSAFHYDRLKKSDKVQDGKKKVNVISIENEKVTDAYIESVEKYRGQTYIDEVHDRVAGSSPIYAKELYGVILDDGSANNEEIKRCLEGNRDYFKDMAVLTDKPNLDAEDSFEGKIVRYTENGSFAKVKEAIEHWGQGKYVVMFSPNITFTKKLETLKNCIINPGTLHYKDFSKKKEHERGNGYVADGDMLDKGICLIINSYGRSYAGLEEAQGSLLHCIRAIEKQWDRNKIVEFSDSMDRNIYELSPGRGGKAERMKDFKGLMRKFISEKGVIGTLIFGIKSMRRYGLSLMVEKIRSRAY